MTSTTLSTRPSGLTTVESTCGRISVASSQVLRPTLIPSTLCGTGPLWCCSPKTRAAQGAGGLLRTFGICVRLAHFLTLRGLTGSALYFDGSSLPREASTKDLQTYTGGVVRFYLVRITPPSPLNPIRNAAAALEPWCNLRAAPCRRSCISLSLVTARAEPH
jgi:hypothetical protein